MSIRHDATKVIARIDLPEGASTRLRGLWLVGARVAWVAVVGLVLVVLIAALPVFFQAAHMISSPETQVPGQLTAEDVRLMQQWSLSLGFYAAYQTAMIGFFRLSSWPLASCSAGAGPTTASPCSSHCGL